MADIIIAGAGLGGLTAALALAQRGFGVVVILFATASYFQYDTLIVAWLAGLYPNGQLGL